ncbi:hypothetical protein ACFQVD_30495 [Streptosporangium amethystogenes subsp. fukuiense]|uniref:Uncharacterized protein n=1 Tax=Streptosporangium amethystogenes subsp. fukuiense TaxID=698418 RepID=A0ABW2T6X6_9ACTN
MKKPELRTLWFAVMAVASVVVGSDAGVLSFLAGAPPAGAILYGFGAFVGAMIFFFAVAHFLASGGTQDRPNGE